MSEDLVNITIDGQKLSVPKGTLLVEAAREIGLEIPVYCYHPKMKPAGACRACVVEVEGQRRPIMTACTTTVMPDMVVHTNSPNAISAREGVLEFLLINHPLDCPVCDRAGECDLQDFTLRYGPPSSRFIEEKRHFEKSVQVGKNVVLDRERCIMCQRCARFCEEIAMEEGLVIVERGNRSFIGTFEGRSFDSKFSGNVIELCPVGALTAKTYRFESRPWEQQHYSGICNVSSIGANITVDVRYDRVVRIRSRINEEIDDGWLTDECRYSHLPIHSEDRILEPRLRVDGKLQPVFWNEAFERLAAELKKESVVSGIAVGSKLSLEDGHMLLRLGRSILETPHVVHEFEAQQLATETPLSGRIHGCDKADVIICLGCDPSRTHAAFELRIKKGLREKAKLVTLGEEPAMVGFSDYQALGKPDKLWAKLVKALQKPGAEKEAGLRLPRPRPWEAGGSTGDSWEELVELVRGASKILVVVAGDVAGLGLENLPQEVDKLGWSQSPHGLLHLRDGVNSVGHDSLGLTQHWTEEQSLTYRDSWGTFNSKAGLGYEDLCRGKTDVLLAAGCDVLAEEGSKKPKFLVALATHPNKTTEAADLVLPLSTWVESHGVYVNTDGRIQFQRQCILPQGDSKPAWQAAKLLIDALEGEQSSALSPRQIYAEIGSLNALLAGVSYDDFRAAGAVHWSYPQQADLGMPRPDLSAIPVSDPDAPAWMPAVPIDSKVEQASRLFRGEAYPAVPGQRDPREVAALLGLTHPMAESEEASALLSQAPGKREGYIPLRVVPGSTAQVAGPTPANRHHEVGVGRRRQVSVPVAQAALAESTENEAEEQA